MIALRAALRDFLARNRKSLRSVGFHNVSVFDSSNEGAELKTDMVLERLEIPQYTVHVKSAEDKASLLHRFWHPSNSEIYCGVSTAQSKHCSIK